MELDRLNSPSTSAITLEVMGHQLQFSQDPNSNHLGTTVWDASMVFVKFLGLGGSRVAPIPLVTLEQGRGIRCTQRGSCRQISPVWFSSQNWDGMKYQNDHREYGRQKEKNSRKGRFCPSKLKGKRVLELGAGCGLAGFGMAMLGCEVVLTDQKEVLPLLRRNVDRNISRITQMNPGSDSVGSIKVVELDWGNMDHIQEVAGPFDYIIGTDVVYAEHLLEPLLLTISALSGPRTTIMLGYEIRSTSVHEQMLQLWKRSFDVKTVPKAKMDSRYWHPSIHIYTMVAKKEPVQENNTVTNEPGNTESDQRKTEKSEAEALEEEGVTENDDKEGSVLVGELPSKVLSDWEVRRYGSMAARLLRDVKIT